MWLLQGQAGYTGEEEGKEGEKVSYQPSAFSC